MMDDEFIQDTINETHRELAYGDVKALTAAKLLTIIGFYQGRMKAMEQRPDVPIHPHNSKRF